jgi:hypothetical protein
VLSGHNLLLKAKVEQDKSDMFADERLHDMQEGDKIDDLAALQIVFNNFVCQARLDF